MCRLFADQPPEACVYRTRSVRLSGHSTSIRLEAAFWHVLEEIAAAENLSLARFLTTLHDEVLEFRGETRNFTSLLRCACLTHVAQGRARQDDARAAAEYATGDRRRAALNPV